MSTPFCKQSQNVTPPMALDIYNTKYNRLLQITGYLEWNKSNPTVLQTKNWMISFGIHLNNYGTLNITPFYQMTRPAPLAQSYKKNYSKSWSVQGRTGWRELVRKKPSSSAAPTSLCYKNRKTEMRKEIAIYKELGVSCSDMKKRKEKFSLQNFFALVWLRVPVYRVQSGFKFSTLRGQIIKNDY